MSPKKLNNFNYKNIDEKYEVRQDEYFRSKLCALLPLSSDNPCKSCHREDLKSNKEMQCK